MSRWLRQSVTDGLIVLLLLLAVAIVGATPTGWVTAGFGIATAMADDDGGEHGGDDGGGDDGGGDDGGGDEGGGDDGGSVGGSGAGGDRDNDGGGDDDSGGDDGDDDDGDDDDGDDDDGGDDDSGDDDSGDDGGGDADGAEESSAAGDSAKGGGNHLGEVPGEIIVLNEDAVFFDEVGSLGFRVVAQQPLGALGITVTRLSIPGTLTPAAARALLRERYPRLLIDSNGLYRSQAGSIPSPDYPRHLIGWSPPRPECGLGIAVGLIDTAVTLSHPALAGRTIEHHGFLGVEEHPAPQDHGTAIAGILVATGGSGVPPGLIPGATLRVAEAFMLDTTGQPAASVVGIAGALDWMVRTRTPVVGLSLTGNDNLLLAIAVKRAAARGTVLVAAAGNGGAAGPASYPAAYPEVLAVAAVDDASLPYADGTQGDYIDLAAPGVGIAVASPQGGLALVSGSSFAVPFVVAAAAMQIAGGVPASHRAVRQVLAAGARDLGAPGYDPVYGWGLLQSGATCFPP